MLLSPSNSHDITPHSLRVHPPKLTIGHEEINSSLRTEFIALTTQYRKDLTTCYIRHLDLLVHALTKAIDDFPNQVRTDIVKIMETMQEPPFIQEVTSLVGPDSFQDRMAHWQQEFATEILRACDEVAVTYSITAAIRRKATIGRDKAESSMHNINDTNNVREVDIEMSDNEEYNVNNCPFTTPNYIGSEKPKKSSTNYPIQKPKPNANANSNTNPNPKLKSSTKNLQPNPFQKSNSNPNPNPNPDFPTKRNPRSLNHRNLLPQYICNITNNKVSRNPHQNHYGPRVLLYNPNRPFLNPIYNPTNDLGHTVTSYAAEATYPPRASVLHPHIQRNSNQHFSASHEPHPRPIHHHHTSPEFELEGYKRERRSYFNSGYTCGDGGGLSHHNGGYMSREDIYPTGRYGRSIQCEGRTSYGSGTRANRRQEVYPHGGCAGDHASHGTNDLPSFPLGPPPPPPPPPPLLPTPPLHTISNRPSHFPYVFNPNPSHAPPPPSLLPTNLMHAPPPFFNDTPMHFPLFPPNNPHNVSLFPNYTPPPFHAFPTHSPPFSTHNSPRFQYSTPPSKFHPHVYEIPRRKEPIRTHNNRPPPTKLRTFPCNNVRTKNV